MFSSFFLFFFVEYTINTIVLFQKFSFLFGERVFGERLNVRGLMVVLVVRVNRVEVEKRAGGEVRELWKKSMRVISRGR